jgi:RNA polymerase sigma-70 factor, ECF subfamily
MTEPSAGTDVLVAAAVAGDRLAVERLLARIRPLVVRYCRARVGQFERSFLSADDVAQEVCLAVLRALPGYRDQGRPFLAFVYGIAAHKVADAHRLAQRKRSDPYDEVPDAPEVSGGPEQQALAGELWDQMSRAIDRLGPCGVDSLLARSSLGRPQAVTARRRSARHQLDGPAIAMANEILQEADMASRQEPDLINSVVPGLSQRMSELLQELPDR